MKRAFALIAIITGLAGCGSLGSTPASEPSAQPTSAPAAAASSPDCGSQGVSWRDNGGGSEVAAVAADLGDIQTAGQKLSAAIDTGAGITSAESRLQSAAASLQADAQAAEADPPPSCITGMRAYYMKAMTDYVKAAADYENSVSELDGGSGDVALGDLKAGTSVAGKANTLLLKATAALKRFENG